MLRELVIFFGIAVGLFFFALAVIYFLVPANALPHFMPGYDPAESKIHTTHGLGFLVLGILGFAISVLRAWGD
jgi:amino acid permease